MNRRAFLGALGLFAAPPAAGAQQAGKVYKVGTLFQVKPFTPEQIARHAFFNTLRKLGWIEGRDATFENRFSEAVESLDRVAADLVSLKVDVIYAEGTPPTRAAKRATSSIPIVMVVGVDPVAEGFVANLSRPTSNITGVTMVHTELSGKRVGLMKELIPRLSRLARLWNPDNPGNVAGTRGMTDLAATMGLRLQSLPVRGPGDFDQAFRAMTAERADALITSADAMLSLHQSLLIELAAKHRIPTMYSFRWQVEAGGLMVYAADYSALQRGAANLVDKILKGAKPADLPVEQPTKFELVINLKTAKALGLTIPASLLQRADQVIE